MKTWIALIIVFISGIVIGIIGTFLFVKSEVLQIMSGDFRRVNKIIINRIDSQLDLNPTQLSAVKDIIHSVNEELAAFRESHQSEVEAIIKKHEEKIILLLDDNQKKEFIEMLEKFKEIRLRKIKYKR